MASQVMSPAVIPIITADPQRVRPKTPRLNPTPSASRLVATESATSENPRVGSFSDRRPPIVEDAFVDHLGPQEHQQSEGQPGPPGPGDPDEIHSHEPPDDRHEKLEQPEVKAQPEDRPSAEEPCADSESDGEGVTSQGHGDQQDFDPFGLKKCLDHYFFV